MTPLTPELLKKAMFKSTLYLTWTPSFRKIMET
jgi:hypothetical protein